MSSTAFCQKNKEKPAVETDLTRARFQIHDIRDKGIIVRLRTDQDRIRALRNEGYTGPAAELAHRDSLINMQLCYALSHAGLMHRSTLWSRSIRRSSPAIAS